MKKPKQKNAEVTNQPVRVLVECSPHRTTGGCFVEGLTPYPAEHESYIEAYSVETLLFCHDVLSIESQPTEEAYQDGDIKRKYIPDFRLKTTFAGKLILESKAIASLVHEATLQKYLSITNHFQNNQQSFAFLIDEQLTVEPQFSSVKLLLRYVTSKVPEDVLAHASQVLVDGPMSIHELLNDASMQLVEVYTLIAKRQLSFDWLKPLNSAASVSLIGQPFEGLKLENILRSTRYGHFLEELAMGRRPTDKRVMAHAKAGRQHRQPVGPSNFVGGFSRTEPTRNLGEAEHFPRAVRSRRNFSTDFIACRPYKKS